MIHIEDVRDTLRGQNCSAMAKAIGVRRSTLSDLKNGKTSDVMLSTVNAIYDFVKNKDAQS